MRRSLRWLVHVRWMQGDRLSKIILVDQQSKAQRTVSHLQIGSENVAKKDFRGIGTFGRV